MRISVIFFFLINFCLSYSQIIPVYIETLDNQSDPRPGYPNFTYGTFDGSQNTLVTVSGRGKVLKCFHNAGDVASASGMSNHKVWFDSCYTELYISFDFKYDSAFDCGYADGSGGSKIFAGFLGGSQINIPHGGAYDTSSSWATGQMLQNMTLNDYSYVKNPENYDAGGWPSGAVIDSLKPGEWHNMAMRLKMNDLGDSNGLQEYFIDDTLKLSLTNKKFRSYSTPNDLIQGFWVNHFWGGGTTSPYASPKDQSVYFDNIKIFYYPQNSINHREGASEAGRVIIQPEAVDYKPVPANLFAQTEYNKAVDTIRSHCPPFVYSVQTASGILPNNSYNYRTATISIPGATQISIKVDSFWYYSGTTYDPWRQSLKIYSGTGAGKSFVREYKNTVYTTIGTVDVINASSATIEWRAGVDLNRGFKITYTSTGGTPGTNTVVCGNFVANQYRSEAVNNKKVEVIDVRKWIESIDRNNYVTIIE
jgi:hypothetical protein